MVVNHQEVAAQASGLVLHCFAGWDQRPLRWLLEFRTRHCFQNLKASLPAIGRQTKSATSSTTRQVSLVWSLVKEAIVATDIVDGVALGIVDQAWIEPLIVGVLPKHDGLLEGIEEVPADVALG